MKSFINLLDDNGVIWVSAELSPSKIKSIIRHYAKLGINLQVSGAN